MLELTHDHARSPRSPGLALAKVVAGWWSAYRRRRRLNWTVETLQGLDDRTLRDIGLDRSEITSVVHSEGAGRSRPRIAVGWLTRG